MKYILILSALLSLFTFSCRKAINERHSALSDSVLFIDTITRYMDLCKTIYYDKGFVSDTINEKDRYIIRSTNQETGHKIMHNMIFSSSFSEEYIIDYNIDETYQNSELIIDEESFKFKDINLLIANKIFKNADRLPLDLARFIEPDAGEIRYFKDETGDEYIFIKCGLLGCSGRYCDGYYILVIKIDKAGKKNIMIIDYSYAYPLDFENMPIFKDKEDRSVNIVLCKAINDDIVRVNINSYSLFNKINKLDKNSNGRLKEIEYNYLFGIDTSKIKIKKMDWY
ncbi:MAG: hypothetical protein ACK5KT_16375 [Dysgonomonas sp.]